MSAFKVRPTRGACSLTASTADLITAITTSHSPSIVVNMESVRFGKPLARTTRIASATTSPTSAPMPSGVIEKATSMPPTSYRRRYGCPRSAPARYIEPAPLAWLRPHFASRTGMLASERSAAGPPDSPARSTIRSVADPAAARPSCPSRSMMRSASCPGEVTDRLPTTWCRADPGSRWGRGPDQMGDLPLGHERQERYGTRRHHQQRAEQRPPAQHGQVQRHEQVPDVEEAVDRPHHLDHRLLVGQVLERHPDEHQDDQTGADHPRDHPVAEQRRIHQTSLPCRPAPPAPAGRRLDRPRVVAAPARRGLDRPERYRHPPAGGSTAPSGTRSDP